MCLAVGTASKSHHHFVIQSQESNVNPCYPFFVVVIVLGLGRNSLLILNYYKL